MELSEGSIVEPICETMDMDVDEGPGEEEAREITSGSACSGLGREVWSLSDVRPCQITDKFACDKDVACQRFLEVNHRPQKLYNDVFDEDFANAGYTDVFAGIF